MGIPLSKTASERGVLTKKDMDDIARLIQGFLKSTATPKEDYNFALGHARNGSVMVDIVRRSEGLNQGYELEFCNVMETVGTAINYPIKEALKKNIAKTFVPAFQKAYGDKIMPAKSKNVKMAKLPKKMMTEIYGEINDAVMKDLDFASYSHDVNYLNNRLFNHLYFAKGESNWEDVEFIFSFVQDFVGGSISDGIAGTYDSAFVNHNVKIVGISQALRKTIIKNIRQKATYPDESLKDLNKFAVR